MTQNFTDIAIIGGGASGLICAAVAGKKYKNKKTITLIEKLPRQGKKILVSGNGRCNLTNINATANDYTGTFENGVEYLLKNFPPQKVIKYFESIGLLTFNDSEGRVYPISKQASSVLDVLRNEIKRQNIDEICDCEITNIIKHKDGYKIISDNQIINAKKVVIATGGKTTKKLGCDGKMLSILKNLGHSISPLSPALTYFSVSSPYLKTLKGIRAGCSASLIENGKVLRTETGELQFTEKGLSGICIFNLSLLYIQNKKQFVSVNLLPQLTKEETINFLFKRASSLKAETMEQFFTGLFHKNLGLVILKESGISPQRKISSLKEKEIIDISKNICSFNFKITAVGDFENAQVTRGGINGNEICPQTFESKICKNLYICGEAIDANGFCGGYNLQFAFASGILVGNNL